jgi:hypothetical protein
MGRAQLRFEFQNGARDAQESADPARKIELIVKTKIKQCQLLRAS